MMNAAMADAFGATSKGWGGPASLDRFAAKLSSNRCHHAASLVIRPWGACPPWPDGLICPYASAGVLPASAEWGRAATLSRRLHSSPFLRSGWAYHPVQKIGTTSARHFHHTRHE